MRAPWQGARLDQGVTVKTTLAVAVPGRETGTTARSREKLDGSAGGAPGAGGGGSCAAPGAGGGGSAPGGGGGAPGAGGGGAPGRRRRAGVDRRAERHDLLDSGRPGHLQHHRRRTSADKQRLRRRQRVGRPRGGIQSACLAQRVEFEHREIARRQRRHGDRDLFADPVVRLVRRHEQRERLIGGNREVRAAGARRNRLPVGGRRRRRRIDNLRRRRRGAVGNRVEREVVECDQRVRRRRPTGDDLEIACQSPDATVDAAEWSAAWQELRLRHDADRPGRRDDLDQLGPRRRLDHDLRASETSRDFYRSIGEYVVVGLKSVRKQLGRLAGRANVQHGDKGVFIADGRQVDEFADGVDRVGVIGDDRRSQRPAMGRYDLSERGLLDREIAQLSSVRRGNGGGESQQRSCDEIF